MLTMQCNQHITQELVQRAQHDGYIHLPQVLSEEILQNWLSTITTTVAKRSKQHLPLHERDTYGKAFIQTVNLWRDNQMMQDIVFHEGLAQLAADLLEAKSVRLYHVQALFKEAGGGHTPWHCDQFYWPLASPKTITAWIPLVPVPVEMGPLTFAPTSHLVTDCRELPISDASHRRIAQSLHGKGIKPHVKAYYLGDVSFHYGWTHHCAGPNRASQDRYVMTIIYMDGDMTIQPPTNQQQANDLKNYIPGRSAGDKADSDLNPMAISKPVSHLARICPSV